MSEIRIDLSDIPSLEHVLDMEERGEFFILEPPGLDDLEYEIRRSATLESIRALLEKREIGRL